MVEKKGGERNGDTCMQRTHCENCSQAVEKGESRWLENGRKASKGDGVGRGREGSETSKRNH